MIAVRNFDELKSMPRDKVAGKIVLFNYPFDRQMAAEGRGGEAYGEAVVYRSDGPSAAARQGAVACLIRSVGGASYRLPHTGQTDYEDDTPKIPAGAVTAEDGDLIADLVRQGSVKMKLILTPQTLPDVESTTSLAISKAANIQNKRSLFPVIWIHGIWARARSMMAPASQFRWKLRI